MKLDSIDWKPHRVKSRVPRWVKSVRNWAENGDGSYSLLFYLTLVLAVGLIVKIGH